MCPEEQDSARYSTLLFSQKMSYTYNMYSHEICTLSGLLATNDAYFVKSLYRIRQYGLFLRNQKRKKNLVKSAPPLLFNIPVPLPRNVFLFYTPSAFLLYDAPILAVNLT